jgi:leader peptidase (prepilin peptidase) / N-methyltransferase
MLASFLHLPWLFHLSLAAIPAADNPLTTAHHVVFIVFLFALGACIGSFLNVVVWRLPRGESVSHPPSHCPNCNHKLAWKDNIPIFGWIFLRGRCRYCQTRISARYPIVELFTALILVTYYLLFFIGRDGPCNPAFSDLRKDGPAFGLLMFMICGLLAASLIDAETFTIPLQIPWLMAVVGIIVHTVIDDPRTPNYLNVHPQSIAGAIALGGSIGLIISIVLFLLGIIPQSFSEGEPALEVDEDEFQKEVERARRAGEEPSKRPREYSRGQIRKEIGKEMLFLLPPMTLALVAALVLHYSESLRSSWENLLNHNWITALLGSLFGALIGAFLVWIFRILGTLAFGRIAMGLGDVHLMFGVGAIIGAGASVIVFFLAPFAGLLVGLWGLLTRKRHELPYGPYLALATAAVLIFYCPIANYLRPGVEGFSFALRNLTGW